MSSASFLMSPSLVVTRPSRLVTTSPTELTIFVPPLPSPTVKDGAEIEPSGFTAAPPPIAEATLSDTPCSCEPLTAAVLVADTSPAATPLSVRAPVLLLKSTALPSVFAPTVMSSPGFACCTRPVVPLSSLLSLSSRSPICLVWPATVLVVDDRPVLRPATVLLVDDRAVLRPATVLLVDDKPVLRPATVLLVDDRPVLRPATVLLVVDKSVLRPATVLLVDDRSVLKPATVLLVDDNPVLRLETLRFVAAIAAFVVDRPAFICATFTASVSAVPAATLVICRRSVDEPTDTLLSRSVTELAPSATESVWDAPALTPSATPCEPLAFAPLPTATAAPPALLAWKPSAVLLLPLASALLPTAVA